MPGPLLSCLVLSATVVATSSAAQQAQPASGPFVCGSGAEHAVVAQSGTGRVTGVVTAPDDARLPGATITITNVSSGWSLVVVTASHGGYSGSGVPPGDYEIKAELHGFQTQIVSRITVTSGETSEASFKLPLSTVTETVTVVGALVKESIESTEIRDSSARDIGEALSQLNGMSLVRKGAIANDVVLHGYQSRNLTVLIDGERIYGACPNGMDPAVFHADFAEVDHLEIGKGPFDMRHQGSLGGLVNVVTRAPGAGLHGRPSFSTGSWGYINPSGVASYGTGRVSGLVGYSYRTGDPYRDGSGTLFTQYANYRPDTVASTAFNVQTGWARVFFSPHRNHSAQVAYTRQQADHVLYPYLLMDGMTDNADRFSASYGIVRDDARVKTISARANYSGVQHWMTDSLRVSSAGVSRDYSMETRAHTATAGGNVELMIGNVTAGVEAFRRNWDATTSMSGSKYVPQYAIPFATIDNVGAFIDYERKLGSRTTLAGGGRFDYSRSAADAARVNTDLYFAYNGTRAVAATDTGTSGKIRVIRQLGTNLEVIAGLGHTVRTPDPQERYFTLRRMGSDWVGNPALRPTANTGVHLGANYHYRRALASVSVYRDWLTDFVTVHGQRRINAVPGVMNTMARSFDNVNARMLSTEFTVTCPITDRLSATVNGTYTRGTKDTNPANGITSPNVAEIAPASGTVSLRYDRAVVFAEARGVFAASQDRVDADLQETPTPGYGVLNLRVGGQMKSFRVTLDLDNVFNKLYVNYNSFQRDPYRTGVRVREPGRNLYASVSYRF
jgi:iron complex outermembrane receptor protein